MWYIADDLIFSGCAQVSSALNITATTAAGFGVQEGGGQRLARRLSQAGYFDAVAVKQRIADDM